MQEQQEMIERQGDMIRQLKAEIDELKRFAGR
jgi:hypothetical protein